MPVNEKWLKLRLPVMNTDVHGAKETPMTLVKYKLRQPLWESLAL